jgi:CubicO group peptidase (beta-lactamase class C family)
MNKLRQLLIVPALCVVLAAVLFSQRKAEANREDIDSETIDEYIAAKMRSARIPGLAVTIVKGDQIIYAKGYGQADPSGRPVTPQTPFLIGSVTKPFTALAVMQLVEQAKVELDAPVQRYIPWFRVADAQASSQITVRQLLYQRSGMPQPPTSQTVTDTDDGALERAVRALATLKLDSPPGQSFIYSNGNYDTLGLIVQTVSGQSYEDYVRQHIFAPLQMRNSYVSQDEALQHGMATGYRWWFGIPVPVTLPFDRSDLPAGYMISSAEDMAHFLIAQLNGGRYHDASILSPDGIALTHVEPVPHTYGMGWETLEVNGRTLVDHDGGNANFGTSVFFDPQAGVGVYVSTNVFSALDVLSSPHGIDYRDGPTVRSIAQTVLSMSTNQPMPDQGIGNARLYVIFDVVLIALTAGLIVWLVRTPGRYRRLKQKGISTESALRSRSALVAALHFPLPLLILYLETQVPSWQVDVTYQPDAAYWLRAVAVILFIKGVLELAMVWRVFSQTSRRRRLAHPLAR